MKFDFAWGGHLPPPKQNLKRRAWGEGLRVVNLGNIQVNNYSAQLIIFCYLHIYLSINTYTVFFSYQPHMK